MSLAVIAMGLHLVSFRSQKLSLFAFCLCTMGFGLWEFHLAASSFILIFYFISLFSLKTKFSHSLSYRFGGHSDGVTPGLVSIPEVKSFRVLFVYYGFRSMGISFSCQPFFYLTFFSFIFYELFIVLFIVFFLD